MLVGYYVLVVLSGNGLDELRAHEARDIQALVVLPALYPLAAAGGAAVRSLLDRQAVDPARRWRAPSAARRRGPSARASRARCTTRWARRCTASRSRRAGSRTASRPRRRAPRPPRATCRPPRRSPPRRRAGLISDLRSDTLDRPLRRRAGPLRARVVGAQRDRRPPAGRRRRPAASGHALRAVLHRARGAGERRAPRGRDAREVLLRDVAPDVVLSRGRRRRRHRRRRRRALAADQRPLRADRHGRARRADRRDGRRSPATAAAGTTVTVRLPAGDVRAAEPWALEEAVE